MSLIISKCEFDKENQIKSNFDVFILNLKNSFGEEIINELKSYGNQFSLNIGYVELLDENDAKSFITLHDQHKIILLGASFFTLQNFPTCIHITNNYNKNSTFSEFHVIGFQRHLLNKEDLISLERSGPSSCSLGKLKDNIEDIEPIMRNSSLILANLNVCKKSYLNKVSDGLVTGIEPESLIQVVRYGVHSPHFKVLGFELDNLDANSDCSSEVSVIATTIWYALEGMEIGPFLIEDGCQTNFVSLKDHDIELEFMYSSKNHKYWVKLHETENSPIPCSEKEYQNSIEGMFPDRLFRELVQE